MRLHLLTRRLALVLSAFALVVVASPLPGAAAADASGCSGQATSFDESGVPIDTAAAPGDGGTADDPLDMMWAGTVEWSGSTDEVIQDGEYQVNVEPQRAGAALGRLFSLASGSALSGPVANKDGKTTAEGTVQPSELSWLPTMLTGVYKVTWKVTSAEASCTGTGYVKVVDDPTRTVTWWVALFLILIGMTGLLLARPRVRAEG